MNRRFRSLAQEALNRGAQQKLTELVWALEWLSDKKVETVLEIGSHDGGMCWALGQITPPSSHSSVAGLDIDLSHARPHNWSDLAPRRSKLFGMNSHERQNVNRVLDWFGCPVDLLFIDGDHNYSEVKIEWDIWSSIVRRGGIIGFHDVAIDGVARLIGEVRSDEHCYAEKIEPGTNSFGIGFLYPKEIS